MNGTFSVVCILWNELLENEEVERISVSTDEAGAGAWAGTGAVAEIGLACADAATADLGELTNEVGSTGRGATTTSLSSCRKWWTTANSVTVVGVMCPLSLFLCSLSTDITLVRLRDRASSSFDKYRWEGVMDIVLKSAPDAALVPSREDRELRCRPELTSSMLGSKETSSMDK